MINNDFTYKLGIIDGGSNKNYGLKYIGIESRKRYREYKKALIIEEINDIKKEKLLITQSITHIELSIFTITNEIDNFPKVNDIETSITLIDEAKRKLKDGESLLKIIRDQLFEKERDKEKLDSRIIEEGEYIKIPKNLEAFEEAVESIKLYIEAINNLKHNHNNKSHIEKEIKSTKDIIEDIKFDIDIIISEIHGLKGKKRKNKCRNTILRRNT